MLDQKPGLPIGVPALRESPQTVLQPPEQGGTEPAAQEPGFTPRPIPVQLLQAVVPEKPVKASVPLAKYWPETLLSGLLVGLIGGGYIELSGWIRPVTIGLMAIGLLLLAKPLIGVATPAHHNSAHKEA